MICIVSCFALMFIKLFLTARKCKVPAGLLFKKAMPALIIGLTTASSTAAFGTVLEINSKKLGIPASALAIAGTLAIIFDFFMTGTRIVISEMELVMEAKHWGTLDEEKLKAETIK